MKVKIPKELLDMTKEEINDEWERLKKLYENRPNVVQCRIDGGGYPEGEECPYCKMRRESKELGEI